MSPWIGTYSAVPLHRDPIVDGAELVVVAATPRRRSPRRREVRGQHPRRPRRRRQEPAPLFPPGLARREYNRCVGCVGAQGADGCGGVRGVRRVRGARAAPCENEAYRRPFHETGCRHRHGPSGSTPCSRNCSRPTCRGSRSAASMATAVSGSRSRLSAWTTVKMELSDKVRLEIGVSNDFVDRTVAGDPAIRADRAGRRREDLRDAGGEDLSHPHRRAGRVCRYACQRLRCPRFERTSDSSALRRLHLS